MQHDSLFEVLNDASYDSRFSIQAKTITINGVILNAIRVNFLERYQPTTYNVYIRDSVFQLSISRLAKFL